MPCALQKEGFECQDLFLLEEGFLLPKTCIWLHKPANYSYVPWEKHCSRKTGKALRRIKTRSLLHTRTVRSCPEAQLSNPMQFSSMDKLYKQHFWLNETCSSQLSCLNEKQCTFRYLKIQTTIQCTIIKKVQALKKHLDGFFLQNLHCRLDYDF